MKIRIKFSKHGCMKFIGHLDIMRYFQKAHIRAGLDMAYSEGFNPHQIMSFAAPLGVGLTSDGEYLDINVKSTESSKVSIEKLNKVMVEGMHILEYKKLPDDAKKSMSLVSAADYYVYPKSQEHGLSNQLTEQISSFLNQDEILVTKKTKKSEKTMDIKPYIYDFSIKNYSSCQEEVENLPAYFLSLATGSETNIKPELVLKAFYEFIGEEFQEAWFQIHRQEVYTTSDGKFVTLGSLGEDIE
ncbi:MAG: TIGR03936 family radical SAM-associated protein [Lachnospiraceae bacterium]|nr:TIGR03936 family radical SAM-associated protein [Lachnospiraceae bacterium]